VNGIEVEIGIGIGVGVRDVVTIFSLFDALLESTSEIFAHVAF